jgi:hypothetical protein
MTYRFALTRILLLSDEVRPILIITASGNLIHLLISLRNMIQPGTITQESTFVSSV